MHQGLNLLIFVSSHLIGIPPRPCQTGIRLGLCHAWGELQSLQVVSMVEEYLTRKNSGRTRVFAYADIHNFTALAELAARYPDRLRLVTCDFNEEWKRSVLKSLPGSKAVSIDWTTEDGGQLAMGELYDEVVSEHQHRQDS